MGKLIYYNNEAASTNIANSNVYRHGATNISGGLWKLMSQSSMFTNMAFS